MNLTEKWDTILNIVFQMIYGLFKQIKETCEIDIPKTPLNIYILYSNDSFILSALEA